MGFCYSVAYTHSYIKTSAIDIFVYFFIKYIAITPLGLVSSLYTYKTRQASSHSSSKIDSLRTALTQSLTLARAGGGLL